MDVEGVGRREQGINTKKNEWKERMRTNGNWEQKTTQLIGGFNFKQNILLPFVSTLMEKGVRRVEWWDRKKPNMSSVDGIVWACGEKIVCLKIRTSQNMSSGDKKGNGMNVEQNVSRWTETVIKSRWKGEKKGRIDDGADDFYQEIHKRTKNQQKHWRARSKQTLGIVNAIIALSRCCWSVKCLFDVPAKEHRHTQSLKHPYWGQRTEK